MATEEKIILSADVTKAAESVGELKEQIKALRETINDSNTSLDDAAAAAELLKVKQQALRAVMAGSAEAFMEVQDASEGTTKSYNELVNQMAKLKAAWRASTDEIERNRLGAQINEINDQLKALDASTGNFQRNVGDYANQMGKAFQATAGSAGSIINPIQGATNALKVMSTTPVIAILGLLANVIMKVIENLKKSESGMTALTEAFSAFQVIGDLVTKVLEGVGEVLAKVIGWIGEFTASLLDSNEAMEEKIRLHQMEKQLMEDERTYIVENAELERDASELRAKAVDKWKYSAEERIKYLEEASEKEKQIAENNKDYAKQEYEMIHLRNQATESSQEDLKAEAEAYARAIQAETKYNNKVRELTAQINEARNQQRSEAAAAAKARQEELKAQAEAEAEAIRQQILAEQRSIAETKQAMVNRMNVLKKGSYEQLAMQVQIKQYEIDTLKQMDDESNVEFEARRIALYQQLQASQLAIVDQQIDEHKAYLELQVAQTEGDAFAELQAKAELARYNWETTYQGLNESYEAYLLRKLEAEKSYQQAQNEVDNYDQTKVDMEAELETMEQNSMIYLEKSIALKQYELDTMHQLEYESESQFQARMLQKEKEFNAEKQKLSNARVNMAMQFANATAGLVNSLAAIYEADTDASEEEQQKAKNLKVAGAVISTIEGAVGAYMNASKAYTPPYGQILGAISAATVVATGMANVRQIESQDVSADSSSTASVSGTSTGSSSSSAVTQAPTMDTVIESVRTITTASEEDALNQSQKVYLVTDELEMAQNARKVRMAESTF